MDKATYLLGVGHRDLADERTDVDEQVEVHVDPRRRQDRVDDDALASLRVANEQLTPLILLSNKRRNVRLETSGTDTHDDDGDNEACQSTIGVVDDARNRGDDEETVAEKCNSDRYTDGLVPAPPSIRNVCTEEGDNIHPRTYALMSFCYGTNCHGLAYQNVLKVPIPVDAR